MCEIVISDHNYLSSSSASPLCVGDGGDGQHLATKKEEEEALFVGFPDKGRGGSQESPWSYSSCFAIGKFIHRR